MKTLARVAAITILLGGPWGCGDDEGSSGGTGAGGGSTASTTSGSSGSSGTGSGSASSGSGGMGATGSGAATSSGSESGSSASTASGGSSGSGGASASDIDGYWVWTKQIENGAVTLEVTDDDMVGKVGPTGWPGCPEGILCTRYGIHKVAFGDNGRLHYQHNVFTSSDFQTLGSWSDGGAGLGDFERETQYSCAHPDSVSFDVVAGTFRYKLEAGELWVSVAGFSGFAFSDPGAEPTTWLVYKAVSRDDYYGKYMIRYCQPFDDFVCQEACFDMSLIDEP